MAELLAVSTQAALDLRDLVRSLERHAPEGVGVRAAGGLLAPGEEGSVLDDARRRGATLLVVAPADADLANHVALTTAVARAAGLAVPAVLVVGAGHTGAREALAAGHGLDVRALADLRAPSADVEGWPLAAWAHAEPEAAAAGEVRLAPYGAWEPGAGAVADPRTAGRDRIDPVLLDVVAAEGPVLASRAFGLVVRASGGHKVTSIVRAPLSSSAHRLRAQGRLALEPTETVSGPDELLRLADAPSVRLRELGPRELHEVPPSELAELMRRLLAAGTADAELPRATLAALGLTRMTARAEGCLARAWALVEDEDEDEGADGGDAGGSAP